MTKDLHEFTVEMYGDAAESWLGFCIPPIAL